MYKSKLTDESAAVRLTQCNASLPLTAQNKRYCAGTVLVPSSNWTIAKLNLPWKKHSQTTSHSERGLNDMHRYLKKWISWTWPCLHLWSEKRQTTRTTLRWSLGDSMGEAWFDDLMGGAWFNSQSNIRGVLWSCRFGYMGMLKCLISHRITVFIPIS